MISVWFAIFCNLACCAIVFTCTSLYYKSIIQQRKSELEETNGQE